MSPITGSVNVERPPDEVFRLAADPMRRGEWQESVLRVAMDDGEVALGAQPVEESAQVGEAFVLHRRRAYPLRYARTRSRALQKTGP